MMKIIDDDEAYCDDELQLSLHAQSIRSSYWSC
jgi:hypothetical protein